MFGGTFSDLADYALRVHGEEKSYETLSFEFSGFRCSFFRGPNRKCAGSFKPARGGRTPGFRAR